MERVEQHRKLRQFPFRERDSLSPIVRSVKSLSKVVELMMTTHFRRNFVSRE